MHQSKPRTTSKETTISSKKTRTQKFIQDSNEENCPETKTVNIVPNDSDHVIPKTNENKADTGINVKTADTETIGYVESVSPSKQNRRDTTDYSDITLQLYGGKRWRAVFLREEKTTSLRARKQQNCGKAFQT